jgi:class 3 adenylate cyclase
VLLLAHPRVPKNWLVTVLPEKLEVALASHNAVVAQQEPIRATATQVRLRVAVHAGEVTFGRHGVVGAAIDYTFRMAEAPPLKDAFANSPDVCGLIVSDWFYDDVVYHHADARPDGYQHVKCQVKQTPVSAWLRVPMPQLSRREPALARSEQPLAWPESA